MLTSYWISTVLKIPSAIQTEFEACLRKKEVPQNLQVFYKKWLRYYLDFCRKYHFVHTQRDSLPHFLTKLQDKKRTKAQQQQASQAISLYYELFNPAGNHEKIPPSSKISPPGQAAKVSASPAGFLSSQTDTSNSTGNSLGSPQKAQPPSSKPAVFSVNEPQPLTGASWKAEYT